MAPWMVFFSFPGSPRSRLVVGLDFKPQRHWRVLTPSDQVASVPTIERSKARRGADPRWRGAMSRECGRSARRGVGARSLDLQLAVREPPKLRFDDRATAAKSTSWLVRSVLSRPAQARYQGGVILMRPARLRRRGRIGVASFPATLRQLASLGAGRLVAREARLSRGSNTSGSSHDNYPRFRRRSRESGGRAMLIHPSIGVDRRRCRRQLRDMLGNISPGRAFPPRSRRAPRLPDRDGRGCWPRLAGRGIDAQRTTPAVAMFSCAWRK